MIKIQATTSAHFYVMKSLFLLPFLFFSFFASAQLSDAGTIDFLTNKSVRAWQFKSIRQSLGSGNCKGDGRRLIFNKDGQVTCQHCENGRFVETKTTWKIIVINKEIKEFAIKFSDSLKISDDYWLSVARIDLPYPEFNKKNKELILRHLISPMPYQRLRETITFTSLY